MRMNLNSNERHLLYGVKIPSLRPKSLTLNGCLMLMCADFADKFNVKSYNVQ